MTIRPSRRHILTSLAAAIALPLKAQPPSLTSPTRRLVVPVSAGSASDRLTREITRLWADRFRLDFEVENIPGAGSVSAASRVLHAPADGRTLLLANSGLFSTVPMVMKEKLKFNPQAELAPLAILVKTPFFLATSADSPVRQLADLRRDGKPTHFAVTTLYGANHLAGSMLFRRLGIEAQVVAYSQDSQILADLASQRVPYAALSWNALRPLVEQGRVRPLCVLSEARAPFVPTVPALGEHGLADCAHEGWLGIFHRREVATETLQTCAQALREIFASRPPLFDLGAFGYVNAYLDAAQAAPFIERDIVRHRALLSQLALN